MTKENHNPGLYIGAAVVAGILGTLSALRHSSRTVQGWTDQAKDVAQQVLEKGEIMNKKMVLGGVAGGLIGAAAALLLAPKSGAELIKDLSHPFSNQGEHGKRSASRKTAARQSVSRKKGERSTKGAASRKVTAKTEEHKPHKVAAKKKLPTRRRTASAALKQAATASEKGASEATAT